MEHRTDAIRYYGLDLGEGDKTAMNDYESAIYQQYQSKLVAQQMQYSLGSMAFGVGQAVMKPPSAPMPVEPLPNKLLLLAEEEPS